MPSIPECLQRRYKALDSLITELNLSMESQDGELVNQTSNTSNAGIKLMCDLWKILKDNPDYSRTEEIQKTMRGPRLKTYRNIFDTQPFLTYMAGQDKDDCCNNFPPQKQESDKPSCQLHSDNTNPPPPDTCCAEEVDKTPNAENTATTDICHSKYLKIEKNMPLSEVLCNLKQAALFDHKCHVRVKDLMEAQDQLSQQIQILEQREKDGVNLMKQADCMWICMEEAYKKKIADTLQRQSQMMGKLKEVEASISEWRKNKKELETQLDTVQTLRRDISDKMNQKKNDIKIIDVEITNLNNRIETNKNDLEASKKSLVSKREASNTRMSNLVTEMEKIKKRTNEETSLKKSKEEEGIQYVKEAREDLQKICKVLLRKKIENEDLRAERAAILEEILLLNTTADTCKDKCANKLKNVKDDINKINEELSVFKAKCDKCHVCTDTNDARKLCTDCPRCLVERDCKYGDDFCNSDTSLDCVCMSVKQKFLDNVFENMYTVLERQSKTNPGKAVADAVFRCLKQSKNGKLNAETRMILQDFILSSVKKNLNLTIIGGAVKTRCEMDPDTYKQLMLCLNEIKAPVPLTIEKGTVAKKAPCPRWGSASECNCPKGPKDCICTQALSQVKDSKSCPEDKDDIGEVELCPYHQKPCGPDCGRQGLSFPTSEELAEWRPAPCSGQTCTFSKNLSTNQCMLGSEIVLSKKPDHKTHDQKDSTLSKTDKSTSRSHPNWSYHRDTHLTADVGLNCDKTICTPRETQTKCSRYKSSNDYKHMSSAQESLVQTARKSSFKTQNRGSISSKRISNKLTNKNKTNAIDFKTLPNKNENSRPLKVAIYKNSDKSVSYNTALTKSLSGKLTMDLDEQVIDLIEKKALENSYLFVSLLRTNSGQLVLSFNNRDDSVRNTQRVRITKTPSGIKLLEIHKSLYNQIQEKDPLEIKNMKKSENSSNQCSSCSPFSFKRQSSTKTGDKLSFSSSKKIKYKYETLAREASSVHVELRKISRRRDASKNSSSDYLTFTNSEQSARNVRTNCASCPFKKNLMSSSLLSETCNGPTVKNELDDFTLEIQNLYVKGKVDISLHIKTKIKTKNNVSRHILTAIDKTPSGTVHIDLKRLSSLGNIPFKHAYPVLLSKVRPGCYSVTINNIIETYNAVLRKDKLGKILLVPTSPKKTCKNESEKGIARAKLYTIKVVHDKDKLLPLPAVLERTNSNNYKLVLFKEYEKSFKKIIHEFVGKERECFVFLEKVGSGFTLDLNSNAYIPPEKLNAVLVKTMSGNIKILQKGPVFDYIDTSTSQRRSVASAQLFGELLGELQTVSSRESHKEHLRKCKLKGQKSSSDSDLYDRVRFKMKINKTLLTEPSVILRHTGSGQYAIILNKKSKKTFINNLRHYLDNNASHEPIKRTDSGQIVIALNKKDNTLESCGSLGITPSGNIYVSVDEELQDKESKNCNLKNQSSNTDDTFTSLKMYDRGITTTCNYRPDNCDCDQQICLCKGLNYEKLDWMNGRNSERKSDQCWIKSNCSTNVKHSKSDPASVSKSNTKSCKLGLPYIVIKPASYNTDSYNTAGKQMFGNKHDCYYVNESISPFHKDRYDSVSNELLEISGVCNRTEKKLGAGFEFLLNNTEYGPSPVDSKIRNSVSYLPLLLPPFLSSLN